MSDALPIVALLPGLRRAVRDNEPVVILAPPGAGKTTRVPPAISECVEGQVLVLQPRRVAARAAATRVASEMKVRLGGTVGYRVRMDNRSSRETKILFMTEGVLLRKLQNDPFLTGVGAVVLDEFHERHLDADLSLALLNEVRKDVREDLRIVVMSATLDPKPIATWLRGTTLQSEGRTFPITTTHLTHPLSSDTPTGMARTIERALRETDGDVLAFLDGMRSIDRTHEALGSINGAQVVRLHGSLPAKEQDAALNPSSQRKVVLSTNVAETSVTVPGVTAVVDSGWVKQNVFDASTGLNRLDVVRVSLASANQRAGRAGRTQAGNAYRLWTLREEQSFAAYARPEIARVDLSSACLQLLGWGSHPSTFGWYQPPPKEAIHRALRLLEDLGAVRSDRLTPMGEHLAALPTHPRLARLLVEGHRLGIGHTTAQVAALLSERRSTPDRNRGGAPSRSDLQVALGSIHDASRHSVVRRLAKRLSDVASKRIERSDWSATSEDEALGKAVLTAWPDRVARRREPGDARARMVGGRGIRLDRTSTVREAELFVCIDPDDSASGPRAEALVRMASAVEQDWLPTTRRTSSVWERERLQARTVERIYYRDLVLAEQSAKADTRSDAALLAQQAARHMERVLPNDPELERFRTRLAAAHRLAPQLGLPDGSVEWLVTLLPSLCRRKRAFSELKESNWLPAAKESIGKAALYTLEQHLPERITVPSGSNVRLDYPSEGPPVLAVRIQEVLGWTTTPTLLGGRLTVRMHLLAPNGRPQQITEDLHGFWTNAYPEIRKELRARYPRHAWPVDPLTAEPQRRPARRKR